MGARAKSGWAVAATAVPVSHGCSAHSALLPLLTLPGTGNVAASS